MKKGKIFMNGKSQAIRLPKEFRFSSSEVLITKIGDALIIVPPEKRMDVLKMSLNMFSSDFFQDGRKDIGEQKREKL